MMDVGSAFAIRMKSQKALPPTQYPPAPALPHIPHHRRHHSWPHCGSGICMREPRSLELRITKPRTGLPNFTPWSFQQATVVPLIAEDLEYDDAEMAGIVRSRNPRVHRLWSRPLLKDRRGHLSVASAEARKHAHRSVLRRLIRRQPLDRSRSLFVMPTVRRAGDETVISGWMPPQNSAQPVTITERNQDQTALSGVDTAKLLVERRHRRCHSEQPRSWREPSASLWPLQEET